ncbi:MAG: methyltransferase domain-containing protein [Deltaproteobacteria bacterium]|nr:methyltransferase domain-containing protein [Deltaproteobacteria bacterium]
MTEDRVQEIISQAEDRYEMLVSSIVEVPDYTIDNLSQEKGAEFMDRCLYEFTEYRKEFGGRLVFMCLKPPDSQTFFLERFRIYGTESPQGIERGDDPSYMNGVGECVYLRIPEGSTIIDIGCGTGKYLKVLSGKRMTALAMDISKDLIVEDRKSTELRDVHFFPGDCVDLRFLKDKEIDYLTGVNILNVLYPEMVESLLEQGERVANMGGLFAFTLPARADLWSDYSPELGGPLKERLNRGSDEYLEIASNQTFFGQMRLLSFVRNLCREKGWRCRVLRFLDSSIYDRPAFSKTLDARYLKSGEDSLLKLLEFPIRRARATAVPPEGSYLVCSIGYGLEIYFGDEALPPADEAHYFGDEVEFEKLNIRTELDDSVTRWNLPFEKVY